MSHLIYGRDKTERIVATERVYANGVAGSMEHVFVRNADGSVKDHYDKIRPFIFASSNAENIDFESAEPAFLRHWTEYPGITCEKLAGNGYYDCLVSADNTYQLKAITEDLDSTYYVQPSRQAQYMLRRGATFFKGMTFKDMLVVYLDIETWSSGQFPNARNPKDVIYVASIWTSTGTAKVLALIPEHPKNAPHNYGEHVKIYNDEKSLLIGLITSIQNINPDVICGHNINNFDFPYIKDRCEFHGVSFGVGRNGEAPHFFSTTMKLAERDIDYTNWKVYGRHVMDTMLLAMKVDVVKRDMPGYGLKVLVRDYLHKAAEDREYIEGNELTARWITDKKSVLRYALDDVKETEILFRTFGQAYFYLSQMLPYGLQDCSRLGSGTLFESIFIREYLFKKHSLPKTDEPQSIPGGFAGIFFFGHVGRPCIYLDVASLYPTLAEDLYIMPRKDELFIYQPVIQELKKFRLTIKSKRDSTKDPDEKETLGSIDGAVKIVLNTGSYGILASQYFQWNDYDEAARITTNGQRVIKSMITAASKFGGMVVKVDTDGMLVALPPDVDSQEKEKEFAMRVQVFVNELVDTGLYEGAHDQLLKIEQLEFIEEEEDEDAE